MKRIVWMDLQLFADGGEGAGTEGAAAPAADTGTGTGAESIAAGTGTVQAGDTLGDGRQVQNAQVAAELNRQMKRHPELRKVYGQRPQAAQPQQQPEQAEAQPGEKTIQERWEEIKKGEMKELYGQDVQKAIQDRFRNQQDARKELETLQPAIQTLMRSRKVDNIEDLVKSIQADDSLLEEEAAEAGMTVDSYRTLKALEDQNAAMKAREEQSIQQQMMRNHYTKLCQQAEELKKAFPTFDLQAELQNEKFLHLTSPEVGVSVEEAFYLVHGKEIAAQSMKAGMERAQNQMGQTIRARGMRPVEGAARGQGQPAASAPMNFNTMSREERERFRSQVKNGRIVIPGR